MSTGTNPLADLELELIQHFAPILLQRRVRRFIGLLMRDNPGDMEIFLGLIRGRRPERVVSDLLEQITMDPHNQQEGREEARICANQRFKGAMNRVAAAQHQAGLVPTD